MTDYPLIADHGLIGDLQTAALVTKDGTVDWFCSPRFDSPSIFGSLLDHRRGGYLRTRPRDGAFDTRQLYLPDTAILITRFLTEAGVGELVDFMPTTGGRAAAGHRMVRMLRCVRGEMTFDCEAAPRFDYGRRGHELTVTENGAVFSSDGTTLTMHAIREPTDERLARQETGDEGDLRFAITLRAGQMRGMVLETGGQGAPRAVPVAEARRLFDETARFWRSWVGQSTYTGRWRELVQRSAITLKLMTYAPSGGLVAAPTAGLPEQVGGERNWDYRYTWVRDASFSVYALLGLGYRDEAESFVGWLMDRITESAGEGSGPLKIMYRVDGSSDLVEETLDHFEGYRGSRPVRIGNGASDQLQLDIYGEAMDSIYLADADGLSLPHAGWTQVRNMVDWVCENWDQPEEGIWETRGGRQSFTYGRFMCWVALDRAVRLAQSHGRPASTARWIAERDLLYEQVMTRGWHAGRG